MSCGCNNGWGDNGIYSGVCDTDTPYPSVSSESIPSLINNLITSLYGTITKDVSSGKVVWSIPCDPSQSATLFGIPRNEGEGLMCYFMRVWSLSGITGIVTTTDTQTLTNKTLASPTLTGNITFPNESVPNSALSRTGASKLVVTSSDILNNTIQPIDLSAGAPSWNTAGDLTLVKGLVATQGGTLAGTFSGGTFSGATLSGNTISGTNTATGATITNGTLSGSTLSGGSFSGTITATGATIDNGTYSVPTINNPAFGGTATGSITSGVIAGVTSISNATPGRVGEVLTSTSGNVTLTLNTFVNLSSITLTPGDWLVWGAGMLTTPATATTGLVRIILAVHTVNNSWDSASPEKNHQVFMAAPTLSANNPSFHLSTSPFRVNVSTNTPYYVNVYATWTANPLIGKGTIFALRIR